MKGVRTNHIHTVQGQVWNVPGLEGFGLHIWQNSKLWLYTTQLTLSWKLRFHCTSQFSPVNYQRSESSFLRRWRRKCSLSAFKSHLTVASDTSHVYTSHCSHGESKKINIQKHIRSTTVKCCKIAKRVSVGQSVFDPKKQLFCNFLSHCNYCIFTRKSFENVCLVFPRRRGRHFDPILLSFPAERRRARRAWIQNECSTLKVSLLASGN